MKALKIYIISLFTAVLVSCSYEFPKPKVSGQEDLGTLNAEKIVAAGDDFLGGVMDGALYSEGQENSVAAIIARQVGVISEKPFVQPGIASENGYNFYASDGSSIYGKWVYTYQAASETEATIELTDGESVPSFNGDRTVLNDLTVPQLRSVWLNSTIPDQNPYYMRIKTGSEGFAGEVTGKAPSLIICWVGMNDFLEFALNGAVCAEATNTVRGTTCPADVSVFRQNIQNFFGKLVTETDAQIIAGNFIPVSDFPFFYIKQYNFIRLTNKQKAEATGRFSAFNKAVALWNVGRPMAEQRPYISFEDNGATLYPQPVVIIDESLPDATYHDGSALEKYRQLIPGEMVLNSVTKKMVNEGYGSIIPLPDKYYLSTKQLSEIEKLTLEFNLALQELEQLYSERIIVADIKSQVHDIAETAKFDSWGIPSGSGVIIYDNGLPVAGDLGVNSIFSIDGVHFNQRGNAFIANIFIEAINSRFSAVIPKAKINDYKGNAYIYATSF